MDSMALTLARSEFSTTVAAIFAVIWALSHVVKILSGDKNKKPGQTTVEAGGAKVSTQERLRRLAEERVRQMQQKRAGRAEAQAERTPEPRSATASHQQATANVTQRPAAASNQQVARGETMRSAAKQVVAVPPPRTVTAEDLRQLREMQGQKAAKAAQPQRPAAAPAPRISQVTPAMAKNVAPQRAAAPPPAASVKQQQVEAVMLVEEGFKLGRLNARKMREALVLKEVLDKPLALREPGEGPLNW
jgi:hypothetical protein